jgi:hypothetical protein
MAKRRRMKEKLLDGLIFLHPITLNRVGGSERRRTRLLEKILGPKAYKRVIIATTMWDVMSPEYDFKARLRGRTGAGGVWHDMTANGASLLKHSNTRESAHEIIRSIIVLADSSEVVETQLQFELRNNKHVNDTAVGRELKSQLESDILLLRKQLAKHERNHPSPQPPRQPHSRQGTPRQGRKRKGTRESQKDQAPPSIVAEDGRNEQSEVDTRKTDEESTRLKNEIKEWEEVKKEIESRLELKIQHLRKFGGLAVS